MKTCSKCGLSKPLEAFCIDRSKPDGHYPSCDECRHSAHRANAEKHNTVHRDYYQRNAEQLRAYAVNYYAEHRDERRSYCSANREEQTAYSQERRARLHGNKIEPVNRAAIITRDHSTCHICGNHVLPNQLTLDHLIPISKGGPHAEWNLAVAHRACNTKRGAGRIPAQPYLPL